MSKYHAHKLAVSADQVKSLGKGGTIVLSHAHLHGHQTVHVTKTQHSHILKAKKEGKGLKLKMSRTQLKHNIKHGDGIFGSIWNYGKKLVRAVAPHAVNAASTYVGANYGVGAGKATHWLGHKLLGEGVRGGSFQPAGY